MNRRITIKTRLSTQSTNNICDKYRTHYYFPIMHKSANLLLLDNNPFNVPLSRMTQMSWLSEKNVHSLTPCLYGY